VGRPSLSVLWLHPAKDGRRSHLSGPQPQQLSWLEPPHIESLNATGSGLDLAVMRTYSWSSRVYVRARLTWLSSARQGTMTPRSAELHEHDYTNAQPCVELGNPSFPYELLTYRLLKKSASATERSGSSVRRARQTQLTEMKLLTDLAFLAGLAQITRSASRRMKTCRRNAQTLPDQAEGRRNTIGSPSISSNCLPEEARSPGILCGAR
jgi:hypothetical protein